MKKKKHSLLFIILFVAFCSIQTTFAQVKLVNSLNSVLVRIDSNQTDGFFFSSEMLSRSIYNNKLFAFGEATHGTKEFSDFRLSLIKNLVTKFNYKVIVAESDFYSTIEVNDYILYGKGSARKCLQAMGYSTWNNQDFLKTIEWLKEYNSSQLPENKVRFYGCDMTVPGVVYTKQFLALKFSQNALKAIEGLKSWGAKSLNNDELANLESLYQELEMHISSFPDTSLFKKSLTTVTQSIDFRKAKGGFAKAQIRDRSMASNIEWVYHNESKNKLIFLAHNAHISKVPLLDGSEKVGGYLKKVFGESYYALATSFYTGNFRAMDFKTNISTIFHIPEQESPDSYEFIFKQCKIPNFYLDFGEAMSDPILEKLLNSKRYLRLIGANYSPSAEQDGKTTKQPLTRLFDGIVFFRATTAIAPSFEWKKY